MGGVSLTKTTFVVGAILTVSFYALLDYFDDFWEEELQVAGANYVKNRLLTKFRQLPLEEKQLRKNEINTLAESEASSIGRYWEHLYNHVYHSLLAIILLLVFNWDKFWNTPLAAKWLFLGWLILVNIVVYFFTNLVLKKEKKYKQVVTRENNLINKEVEKAILIDSMGFVSEYQTKQRIFTAKKQKFRLSLNHTSTLNKVIPHSWLIWLFPALLVWLLGGNFDGMLLVILWQIFSETGEIIKCFWDYGDYASSLTRINNFLTLPKKDDNLRGRKLVKLSKITAIHFENVSFCYAGQTEPILKNYDRIFTPHQINYLLGANGTGKSTILYLLLGMLKPQDGQIILKTEKGESYNLHQEINLQYWREHNVAYCSHENLIEDGSTGQKQWTSINNIFMAKKMAQIWLFDEADNALDEKNKKKLQEKIKDLIEKDKIVIYIAH